MPSVDHLIPFAIATFLFAVFPGPALLYTAAQTLARGRYAGFMAALGIHIGGYAHVVAAALGLSALPLWLQFLALGVIVNAAFTAADLLTVVLASSMLSGLRRHGLAQPAARMVAGSVLIGLGACLAISRD
jgi:threonine/homoserine/homoserine lactone efflux protein